MNKKFSWIVIGLLLWFVVIASFGIYYLYVSSAVVENSENSIVKDVDCLKTKIIPEDVNFQPIENKVIVPEPKDKTSKTNMVIKTNIENTTPIVEPIKNDSAEKTKDNNLNVQIKKPIEPENTKEEIGGLLIVGHVLDLKNNHPIENTIVSFYSGDGLFLKQVNADKNGYFEAKGIKANIIHIRLQKEHYINGVYKNFSLEELGQHLLLKMDPGLTISGIIKEKASGQPLVGVSIELYRGNSILKKSGASDLKGAFTVDAVPQGSLELVFTKIGFSQTSQAVNVEKAPINNLEVFIEKSSSLSIEIVTLGGFFVVPKIKVYFDGNLEAKVYERSILSQDQDKNIFRVPGIDRQYSKLRVHAEGFTFPAEKPLVITPGLEAKVVFEIEKGMTVSGSVHGVNGNVLPNVTIKLYEIFGGGRAIGDDILKGTVNSDKNGKFSVSGITVGNIEIITSSTVYKRVQKKFLVEEKNNPELDLILEVESFFSGTVTDSDNKPVNVSEVRFVPINIEGSFDPKRDRPVFEGVQSIGEFRMSGVLPGLYRLSITASGFIAFIEERYEVKAEQVSGVYKLTKGLSISGEVKTESGAPIVDVEVKLMTSLKESNVKYRSTTDYNGFFSISGLEENINYKLQVQGKGFQLYEKEISVKSGLNHLPIVLIKKLSFSGVVIDSNTQLPIQNFQIKMYAKISQGFIDDSSETFNVSNGQFSIPVNAEIFNMEIKTPGYALYRLNNIKISDPIKNHYLIKAGSIKFKVMIGKEPCSMKLIKLALVKDVDADEDKRSGRTDSNGNALLQNLKPGNYYVRISDVPGLASYDDIVSVQEEVETVKNIVLIPGLSVKGRVINSTSNIPLKSGEVYLDLDKYGKVPLKLYLDADGFFEYKNVNIGKHTISINYGTFENSKFSQNITLEITVPDFVNNPRGVYQLDDILVK